MFLGVLLHKWNVCAGVCYSLGFLYRGQLLILLSLVHGTKGPGEACCPVFARTGRCACVSPTGPIVALVSSVTDILSEVSCCLLLFLLGSSAVASVVG